MRQAAGGVIVDVKAEASKIVNKQGCAMATESFRRVRRHVIDTREASGPLHASPFRVWAAAKPDRARRC
jgi:hypothetical protein